MDKNVYLFVYGTLMKNHRNYNKYLFPYNPITIGIISGYEMYEIGPFPGIIEGVGHVKGEVYNISLKELEQIDRLEGEGRLFSRKKVPIRYANDKTMLAWAYVYNFDIKGYKRIRFEEQPYKE